MDRELQAVVELFRAYAQRQILVVTGAGISLASGIPTFRGSDAGAIWKKDVTELGSFRYFSRDPVGSWRWYLARFEKTAEAKPNPAHTALVALERWCQRQGGEFLLVTQNIDGLHRAAGSQNLIEVHGRADRIRCPRHGCKNGAPAGSLDRAGFDLGKFAAEPSPDTLPRCPCCQAVLRQHVLWFDEYYDSHRDYQWPRVLGAAATADAVLFVGTSFSVGVTDLILNAALERHRPIVSIDPAGAAPAPDVVMLRSRAEAILPAACARLGAALARTTAGT
ncbi:MAG: NAD-dependent deacylase [Deltaproteobacteria bacterium]|nr:NAD-dependent deacylase [Deltaproteobacteria bacterium]